jgi:predicted Ser/Thr protein kinase
LEIKEKEIHLISIKKEEMAQKLDSLQLNHQELQKEKENITIEHQ